MPTWKEEFHRLSEIEREAIAEWLKNGHASNAVVNAKETTNALLIKYQSAGCPAHDEEMPG
jgi:hypothetical protein